MGNFLTEAIKVATEAMGTVVEREYTYFLEMHDIEAFVSTLEGLEVEGIVEGSFPYIENSPKTRIRHYVGKGIMTDEALLAPFKHPYELTTKSKLPDGSGSKEENTDIPENAYKALKPLMAKLTSRMRVYIPVMHNDAPVVREDGTELAWEVDLFVDRHTKSFSPWVKLELEVDEKKAATIAEYIPFEYKTLIDNGTATQEERDIISDIYDSYDIKHMTA